MRPSENASSGNKEIDGNTEGIPLRTQLIGILKRQTEEDTSVYIECVLLYLTRGLHEQCYVV